MFGSNPSASSFLGTKIAYFVSLSCLFASTFIQTHSIQRASFSFDFPLTHRQLSMTLSLPFSPLCALTLSLFATPHKVIVRSN
ncbi:MAG: hypothetical protein BYD32DRAFT_411334 [Podila humilis]|nr:MAG: hypothetical protein BYD32DRAFT_411334 [Podila humilis]